MDRHDEETDPVISAVPTSIIKVEDAYEKRMQILEIENGRLMKCQGQIIKETNRKLELYTNENRFLQYAFNKLKKQNEELRELCCFLDDDRKLAKKQLEESHEIEKSKAVISAQIIAEHEENLKAFEEREKCLTEENRRLKLMCDSWIEYTLKNSSSRDCGDGSSDSENLYPKSSDDLQHAREEGTCGTLNLTMDLKEDSDSSLENTVREQLQPSTSYGDLLLYIKSLESRVNQLEHERQAASLPIIVEKDSKQTLEGTSANKEGEEDEEDNSLETSSSTQEEQTSLIQDREDKSSNAEWAEQFEEESSFYLNQLRNGYYSGRDDNDNLVLSPIAEESETESCSSYSTTDDDLLETKHKYPPKISLDLKCDQFNDNDGLQMISRKNIKHSTDWNENIHKTVTNLEHQSDPLGAKRSNFKSKDPQEHKINSSTSIDVCGAQSLLDMFSNNLQSTTI